VAGEDEIDRTVTKFDFDGTRTKVVEMFVSGHGIEYTARVLGLTRKTVARIRDEELRKESATRERMIELTRLRHEFLLRPVMDRYLKAGERADRKDAEIAVVIMREQRRLMGLDAPVRVDVKDVTEYSDAELEQALAKELATYAAVKQLPPPVEPVADAEFRPTPSIPHKPTSDRDDRGGD
jgi:hypothetical protein